VKFQPGQQQRLRAALFSAFPYPGEMATVIRHAEIGTSLDNFLAAPGTTYEDALSSVVGWVGARNLVENLLWAAHAENDGNEELQAVFIVLVS